MSSKTLSNCSTRRDFRPYPHGMAKRHTAWCSKSKPDLIISDVRMPRLDGRGLLARLSQSPAYSNIPFIFLTALIDRDDQRAGMELGADDYITKPFTRKDLLEAVQRRLDKHKQIRVEAVEKSNGGLKNLNLAMPYEMLQPLSQILVMANHLKQMRLAADSEAVHQTADSIRMAAEGLMHTISNYLLLGEVQGSLGETNSATVGEPDPVDVRGVIEELVESLFWEYGRSDDLALELEDCRLPIRGEIVSRIIEELVRNALAGSIAGDPVSLSGKAQAEIGYYQLLIYAPKNTLHAEQIHWLESDGLLPLTEFMRVGIGMILAQKLAAAIGCQLCITQQENERVCIELCLPFHPHSTADKGSHV